MNSKRRLKVECMHIIASGEHICHSIVFTSDVKNPELVFALKKDINCCLENAVVLGQSPKRIEHHHCGEIIRINYNRKVQTKLQELQKR